MDLYFSKLDSTTFFCETDTNRHDAKEAARFGRFYGALQVSTVEPEHLRQRDTQTHAHDKETITWEKTKFALHFSIAGNGQNMFYFKKRGREKMEGGCLAGEGIKREFKTLQRRNCREVITGKWSFCLITVEQYLYFCARKL